MHTETHIETPRHTQRYTEKQQGTQRQIQRDKQTDKETNEPIQTETYRDTETYIEFRVYAFALRRNNFDEVMR